MEPWIVERRLTTILSAGVAGYGRLMEQDEAGITALDLNVISGVSDAMSRSRPKSPSAGDCVAIFGK